MRSVHVCFHDKLVDPSDFANRLRDHAVMVIYQL